MQLVQTMHVSVELVVVSTEYACLLGIVALAQTIVMYVLVGIVVIGSDYVYFS